MTAEHAESTTSPDSSPQQPEEQEPDTNAPSEPVVVAAGLDHGSGPHRVFAGLDFTVPAGTLGVVCGTDGSGRSTLLLSLIGRASGIRGSLQVAGFDAIRQARQVRRISTAARIGSFVDLEPKHSIQDALRERAATEGIGNAAAAKAYDEIAGVLDLKLSADRLVEELDSYHRTLLALALATLRPSDLIVLDDLEHGLSLTDQDHLYRAIHALMEHTGSTVVAAGVESETIPAGAVRIDLPDAGTTDPHSR